MFLSLVPMVFRTNVLIRECIVIRIVIMIFKNYEKLTVDLGLNCALNFGRFLKKSETG